jgi:hypothetical protein
MGEHGLAGAEPGDGRGGAGDGGRAKCWASARAGRWPGSPVPGEMPPAMP